MSEIFLGFQPFYLNFFLLLYLWAFSRRTLRNKRDLFKSILFILLFSIMIICKPSLGSELNLGPTRAGD